MFELIKNIIKSKEYKLEDILNKINILWIKCTLTEEQKDELLNLARENAVAENSYKPLQEQINILAAEIKDLKVEIASLKSTDNEEIVEEYPEYVEPIGAHDAYQLGDKITYNDKKYICIFAGCVWNPEQYPQGWQEVVETTETKTEVAE